MMIATTITVDNATAMLCSLKANVLTSIEDHVCRISKTGEVDLHVILPNGLILQGVTFADDHLAFVTSTGTLDEYGILAWDVETLMCVLRALEPMLSHVDRQKKLH